MVADMILFSLSYCKVFKYASFCCRSISYTSVLAMYRVTLLSVLQQSMIVQTTLLKIKYVGESMTKNDHLTRKQKSCPVMKKYQNFNFANKYFHARYVFVILVANCVLIILHICLLVSF